MKDNTPACGIQKCGSFPADRADFADGVWKICLDVPNKAFLDNNKKSVNPTTPRLRQTTDASGQAGLCRPFRILKEAARNATLFIQIGS
jgi:hypothetical protein